MIDNPDQVERLPVKLQQALPLPARMTPRLIATLRAHAPLSHPHRSRQIKSASYAGDEGGIVCHLEPEDSSSEVVVVSIVPIRRGAPTGPG
jgi:hypothetical protein